MPSVHVQLQEGFQFSIQARNHTVVSDQPTPTGTDAGMTPPELFASALGSCVGVYVANFMRRRGLEAENLTIEVAWELADKPMRIGKIHIEVHPGVEVPDNLRGPLQSVAESCLIHQTLHHAPEIDLAILG